MIGTHKTIVKKIRSVLPTLMRTYQGKSLEIDKTIKFLMTAAMFDFNDEEILKIVKPYMYQEFNGLKFIHDGRQGYYRCRKAGFKDVYMHRYIWEYYNGEIPKNCVIHHIDFDRANNDISNLQLMNKTEHRKLHEEYDKNHKKIFLCEICRELYEAINMGHNKYCPKCRKKAYSIKNVETQRIRRQKNRVKH